MQSFPDEVMNKATMLSVTQYVIYFILTLMLQPAK
ncbi:MAG: hypothetical protein K0R14_1248 [Burkholderiales bacterium]|jgi:hypothetical protein|nr:hypothetical protein [Burkholderiales bacterium]